MAAAAALLLAGCSDHTEQQEATKQYFGYQAVSDLRSTNAGTLAGATDNAELLSGRLYPGVYVPGPSGEMIPNTDLVTTQVLPGDQRKVIYTPVSYTHLRAHET